MVAIGLDPSSYSECKEGPGCGRHVLIRCVLLSVEPLSLGTSERNLRKTDGKTDVL